MRDFDNEYKKTRWINLVCIIVVIIGGLLLARCGGDEPNGETEVYPEVTEETQRETTPLPASASPVAAAISYGGLTGACRIGTGRLNPGTAIDCIGIQHNKRAAPGSP